MVVFVRLFHLVFPHSHTRVRKNSVFPPVSTMERMKIPIEKCSPHSHTPNHDDEEEKKVIRENFTAAEVVQRNEKITKMEVNISSSSGKGDFSKDQLSREIFHGTRRNVESTSLHNIFVYSAHFYYRVYDIFNNNIFIDFSCQSWGTEKTHKEEMWRAQKKQCFFVPFCELEFRKFHSFFFACVKGSTAIGDELNISAHNWWGRVGGEWMSSSSSHFFSQRRHHLQGLATHETRRSLFSFFSTISSFFDCLIIHYHRAVSARTRMIPLFFFTLLNNAFKLEQNLLHCSLWFTHETTTNILW